MNLRAYHHKMVDDDEPEGLDTVHVLMLVANLSSPSDKAPSVFATIKEIAVVLASQEHDRYVALCLLDDEAHVHTLAGSLGIAYEPMAEGDIEMVEGLLLGNYDG